MKIRLFGLIALALVMVMMFAACTPATTTSSTTSETSSTTSETSTTSSETSTTTTEETTTTTELVPVVVSFDGEDVTLSDVTITAGETITAPEVTAPAGKVFVAWYDAAGNRFDFATPITDNMTLTAVFGIQYMNYDFGAEFNQIHYADHGTTEAPSIINGLTQYYGTASGAANGYIKKTYTATLNQGDTATNPIGIEVMKNLRNLATIKTADSNTYLAIDLDSTTTAPYVTITANQEYNVGLVIYTLNANVLGETVVISYDFRMSAEGKFAVMTYARKPSSAQNGRGQDRSTLFAIDTNGDICVNYDTANENRIVYVNETGAYYANTDKVVLANAAIGEWHNIAVEMIEFGELYLVDLYLDGVKITEDSLHFKSANMKFSNASYNVIMLFGGGAVSTAINDELLASGSVFQCEYAFDNFKIVGISAAE